MSGGGWNEGGQSIPSEEGHGLCLDLGCWETRRNILAGAHPAVPAVSYSPRVVIDCINSQVMLIHSDYRILEEKSLPLFWQMSPEARPGQSKVGCSRHTLTQVQ